VPSCWHRHPQLAFRHLWLMGRGTDLLYSTPHTTRKRMPTPTAGATCHKAETMTPTFTFKAAYLPGTVTIAILPSACRRHGRRAEHNSFNKLHFKVRCMLRKRPCTYRPVWGTVFGTDAPHTFWDDESVDQTGRRSSEQFSIMVTLPWTHPAPAHCCAARLRIPTHGRTHPRTLHIPPHTPQHPHCHTYDLKKKRLHSHCPPRLHTPPSHQGQDSATYATIAHTPTRFCTPRILTTHTFHTTPHGRRMDNTRALRDISRAGWRLPHHTARLHYATLYPRTLLPCFTVPSSATCITAWAVSLPPALAKNTYKLTHRW